MAINACAQRITCSRHRCRRNGENYKNSLSKLQHRVASYNTRAALMRQATDPKPAATVAESRSQPAPKRDDTTNNSEQKPSEWAQELTKALLTLFNEYTKNKPNPETKNLPASGSNVNPLTGVIKTQPKPTKSDPYLQWLLERTPPRKLPGGKHERSRSKHGVHTPQDIANLTAKVHQSSPKKAHWTQRETHTAAILNAQNNGMAVIDGGATIFMSPNRRHFIKHTLVPTLQRIIGVDGVAIRADAEGYAQVAFADHHTKKICRATMRGLLTEKAHPSGLTLISYPQWQREEGVGLSNPTDHTQPARLYTGENDSSVEFLVDYDQGGLLSVPLLDGNQVTALQHKGYILEDITSPPTAVLDGHGRSREIFRLQRTLTAVVEEGETPKVVAHEHRNQGHTAANAHVEGRALRRLAAKLDQELTDPDEAQNLRRLLPRRMLQTTKVHATMGYPAEDLFRNLISNTTGHGLKPSDTCYLRKSTIPHLAYHGAPPGRKGKGRHQLKLRLKVKGHKTPTVDNSEASSTPKLKHSPKLPDPRRHYQPFESFAIDTLVHQSRGIQDYKYALTCVELHTKYTYTYLMKKKNEAYFALRRLKATVKAEHGATIRHLYSDGAKEFVTCSKVGAWARRNGIKQSVSSPHIHWMQGAVENMNKEYKRITRALLKGAGHPKYMWPLAHAYAQTIINYRYRTKGHNMSPHERAFGTQPDLTHLHVYGTPVEVRVHNPKSLQA